jgi:tRNA (guanine-N7-)-methyltransferase
MKSKGPDLLEAPEGGILQGAWLPSRRILEPYDWGEVFPGQGPVEIELGAGDGGYILEWARRNPGTRFVAVERLLGRARKIVKRTQAEGLANLKTLRLESAYTVRWLFPPGGARCAHILFPDPWPKKRHHKRRLIQLPFLEDLRRMLEPGGEARFVTDHAEYFQWAGEVWASAPGWTAAPLWEWGEDPLTDFQKVFPAEGRGVHRMRWRRD